MADNDKAHEWVAKYANGGLMCRDCRYSEPDHTGWSHTCQVEQGETRSHIPLEPWQCPALPSDLYPEEGNG